MKVAPPGAHIRTCTLAQSRLFTSKVWLLCDFSFLRYCWQKFSGFIHSLTNSFIHSFIHSLTHSHYCCISPASAGKKVLIIFHQFHMPLLTWSMLFLFWFIIVAPKNPVNTKFEVFAADCWGPAGLGAWAPGWAAWRCGLRRGRHQCSLEWDYWGINQVAWSPLH